MPRTAFVAVVALLSVAPPAGAQTAAPTRAPSPSTPEQDARIRAGVELHDKQQYDDAIAAYQGVLKENADNLDALYELAYSYLEKKDFAHSLEAARRGTQYTSEMLPMFYDMIATNFEEQKQPDQAVRTYKQGLAIEPGAGLLYHNLAITYRDLLKDPRAARQTLEQGAAAAPGFPGIPLLLGQWFESDGYRTQAFLALSRALVLDPQVQTYALWRRVLKGPDDPMAKDVMQDPDMRRSAAQRPSAARSQPPRTDEGDFGAVDAKFGPSFAALLATMDDGTPEAEALVAQVGAILEAVAAQKANPKKPAFVVQQYVPFFAAMKERNLVEPFVYWACQRAPVRGVREWLQANEATVREFRTWAAQYRFPGAPAPSPKR